MTRRAIGAACTTGEKCEVVTRARERNTRQARGARSIGGKRKRRAPSSVVRHRSSAWSEDSSRPAERSVAARYCRRGSLVRAVRSTIFDDRTDLRDSRAPRAVCTAARRTSSGHCRVRRHQSALAAYQLYSSDIVRGGSASRQKSGGARLPSTRTSSLRATSS